MHTWGNYVFDDWKTRNDACFNHRYHNDYDVVVYRLCSLLNRWAILQKNEEIRNLEDQVKRIQMVLMEAFADRVGWVLLHLLDVWNPFSLFHFVWMFVSRWWFFYMKSTRRTRLVKIILWILWCSSSRSAKKKRWTTQRTHIRGPGFYLDILWIFWSDGQLEKLGSLKMRDLYLHLRSNGILPFRFMWKIKIVWLVLKNSILTRIIWLEESGNIQYHFCSCEETVDHLLFWCPLAKLIWQIMVHALGLTRPPVDTIHCVDGWLRYFPTSQHKLMLTGGNYVLDNLEDQKRCSL